MSFIFDFVWGLVAHLIRAAIVAILPILVVFGSLFYFPLFFDTIAEPAKQFSAWVTDWMKLKSGRDDIATVARLLEVSGGGTFVVLTAVFGAIVSLILSIAGWRRRW